MLPLAKIEDYDSYYRYLPVEVLDDIQLSSAKDTFAAYRLRGVIQNRKFSDQVWTLSSEVKTRNLNFTVEAEMFQAGAGKWAGVSCRRYLESSKVYICLMLGEIELSHLAGIAGQLKKLAGLCAEECPGIKEPAHSIAFLKLLPGHSPARDLVIEEMEERLQAAHWRNSRPRRLTDFRNYLAFEKALKAYWQTAGEQEKRLYFPVYFWWSLTAILPLRATEFLLIPGDCLRLEDEKHIIRIRRTLLKKKRKVTYRIDTDYEIREYEIPEQLAGEILKYQGQTDGSGRSTLLAPPESAGEWYLTYGQLAARLKKFLKEAVAMPGLDIHIGDTRHLAMINLILSGGSPAICRELAGHESIDISSNYYANLSSIIESTVYE